MTERGFPADALMEHGETRNEVKPHPRGGGAARYCR
jgi:hypothetical protein